MNRTPYGISSNLFKWCNVCNMSFSNLIAHKWLHAEKRPFKCDFCDHSFARNATLKRHLLTHKRKKSFKCVPCNISFPNRDEFITHKYTHPGTKTYECDVCSKKFSASHHLKYHKMTHTGERPFMCDLCGKSFSQKSTLRQHNITHTGERPFKCDLCDKSFGHKSTLVQHKRLHTNKSATCDICDKTFFELEDLRSHIFSHTKEVQYNCVVCGNTFPNNNELRKHEVMHTGDEECSNLMRPFANYEEVPETSQIQGFSANQLEYSHQPDTTFNSYYPENHNLTECQHFSYLELKHACTISTNSVISKLSNESTLQLLKFRAKITQELEDNKLCKEYLSLLVQNVNDILERRWKTVVGNKRRLHTERERQKIATSFQSELGFPSPESGQLTT